MNKTLRPMLLAACLVTAAASSAQSEYKYLAIKQTDGSYHSLLTKGLKLTFTDGKLTLANESEQASFPLNALHSMKFSATALSVSNATADKQNLKAEISQGLLTVSAPASPASVAYLLDAQGKTVATISLSNGRGTHAVAGLPAGTYILKVNNQTLKISR